MVIMTVAWPPQVRATVPAGGHGAWVLPGVPTADAQRLRAAGTIRVAGPVPPATVAFTVTAEL